jgi:hypothetical protein
VVTGLPAERELPDAEPDEPLDRVVTGLDPLAAGVPLEPKGCEPLLRVATGVELPTELAAAPPLAACEPLLRVATGVELPTGVAPAPAPAACEPLVRVVTAPEGLMGPAA